MLLCPLIKNSLSIYCQALPGWSRLARTVRRKEQYKATHGPAGASGGGKLCVVGVCGAKCCKNEAEQLIVAVQM